MIKYGFRHIIFQSICFSTFSESMVKYYKNNMYSPISKTWMSFVMFVGLFEDSSTIIFGL